MAYLQHKSWKDRPGAIAGVVAIHAVIGYALINGLSFSQIVERVKNPEGVFVPEVPLPPPPPPPDEVVEPRQEMTPPMHAPTPPMDLSPQRPPLDAVPDIVPIPQPIPYVVPKPTPQPGPSALPTFDVVSPKPRGNPGAWVTVNDYRSSWINREMTGTARFKLDIGASGRVDNCTITASSGHPELDKATCALVTQRARFDPAKDETGTKVPGTWSNAVRWELPE